MGNVILDELVAIQKKGDAPKYKKIKFIEEMKKLLEAEGLSEEAVEYLRRGFSFCGAYPFAEYYYSTPEPDRNEVLHRLISSEVFTGKDVALSFKFAASLLGYGVMYFGEDATLLKEMIKIIPSKSLNKEKKTFKEVPRFVDKYFLSLIEKDTEMPDLSSLGLKEVFISEFREVMRGALCQLQDIPPEISEKVRVWLAIKEEVTGEPQETDQTPDKESEAGSEENQPEEKNTGDDKQTVKMLNQRDVQQFRDMLGSFMARLEDTTCAFDQTKKESDARRKRIEVLEEELSRLKLRFEEAKEENERLQEVIAGCENSISDLQLQLQTVKKEKAQKETHIQELTEELAKLRSIISVYNADKQNSQAEMLNAIAAKLRSEYLDFTDALNEEMTLDLGENFRFQLQSIFKILVKSGIDVEKG